MKYCRFKWAAPPNGPAPLKPVWSQNQGKTGTRFSTAARIWRRIENNRAKEKVNPEMY